MLNDLHVVAVMIAKGMGCLPSKNMFIDKIECTV